MRERPEEFAGVIPPKVNRPGEKASWMRCWSRDGAESLWVRRPTTLTETATKGNKADRVLGPTMPSTSSLLSSWNLRTALSVSPPKTPSGSRSS